MSITPLADEAVERVLEFGAKKHGDMEAGREIDSHNHTTHAALHLEYWIEGHSDKDIETGEHQFAHAIARLKIALEWELRKEQEQA